MNTMIKMDRRILQFLAEHDGRLHIDAFPMHLFSGGFPAGAPTLDELGFMTIDGDYREITEAGRKALEG